MKDPVAGPEGGEKGVAGKRGGGRGVSVKRRDRNLQSADLGRGQWFAAGFMGKLLGRENSYPVRFAKDSFGKSSG